MYLLLFEVGKILEGQVKEKKCNTGTTGLIPCALLWEILDMLDKPI